MVWALTLLPTDISTRRLTPALNIRPFGVYLRLIGGEALSHNQSLYLTNETCEAVPKDISGSTSYLPV